MRDVVILAPNFVHNSAGVGCLWYLGEYLVDLGYRVYVFNYQCPNYPPPAWSRMVQIMRVPIAFVVVAPETYNGSLDMFPLVIRWALNKPGLLGGPSTYPANTKVIHFSPEIEEAAKAASVDTESTELMLGTISMDLMRRHKVKRDTILYYLGKKDYPYPIPLEEHKGHVELTRSWPATKDELYDLFARTSTLYSYDSFSAVNLEAHLCGIKVFTKTSTINPKFWVPHTPPPYYKKLLLDHDRDRARVKEVFEYLIK